MTRLLLVSHVTDQYVTCCVSYFGAPQTSIIAARFPSDAFDFTKL